jgi:FtsZ-interacting cell division protein ZipA
MNNDDRRYLLRSVAGWFDLTSGERRAIALILVLALAGLIARYWHSRTESRRPFDPGKIERQAYRRGDSHTSRSRKENFKPTPLRAADNKEADPSPDAGPSP